MTPRVALVHDWLVGWGGSESVLLSLSRLYPEAPIYTSVWAPDARTRAAFEARTIRPTVLQRVPGARRAYRHLLPLMPSAFRRLDLSRYDLVLTSSHAFSKAVRVAGGAQHVCYCHTPPRYLWDLASEYGSGLGALAFRGPVLHWLRRRDLAAAAGVQHFLANSEHVRNRIARTYGRDATVVYPPVDVPESVPDVERQDHFVAGGRLVAYKRVDLAIRAANRAGFQLVVFGDGPERGRLEGMAGPTVTFVGRLSDRGLCELLASARAYLFPGEEDFGILPVEAQAVGTPVVALDRGGARETVVRDRTGLLFPEADVSSLLEALRELENTRFDRDVCHRNATRFGRARFEGEVQRYLAGVVDGREASNG